MATITISVNISEADKMEGDALFRLHLPENHIKYLDRNKLASELDILLTTAIDEYWRKNNDR